MKSTHFDVIVAGGGPAGSITAYLLAKAGIRTAVMDANTFPRPKACGGGLQARAMVEIPFDISHLLRGTLHRITLSYGLRDPWTRTYPEPLVYSILRSEFDHYLIQCAERAGAYVHQASPIKAIEVADRGPITVHTEAGEFRARCLVGADGANSVVRRALNQREDYFWQVAVYCEVPEDVIDPNVFRCDAMIVDWGTLSCGYAWAIPKRGSVNVGAGGPIAIAKHLKRYVRRFVEATRLLKNGSMDRLNLIGHQLPTWTTSSRLSGRNVLLVGDAAGLVEPFTGDGISFACQSARIAAAYIHRALNNSEVDLTGYDAELVSKIAIELLWSRKLLSISAAFPRLVYHLFKKSDRVWNTFCKTLRGEETFHRLKQDVLGPLEFAWRVIDLLTQSREQSVLRTHRVSHLLRDTQS